jgi:hypothetical protein
MQMDVQRIAARCESRFTAVQIEEMHNIARRFKEMARNSRHDENMEAQGGEQHANMWKLIVEVSIDAYSLPYYN